MGGFGPWCGRDNKCSHMRRSVPVSGRQVRKRLLWFTRLYYEERRKSVFKSKAVAMKGRDIKGGDNVVLTHFRPAVRLNLISHAVTPNQRNGGGLLRKCHETEEEKRVRSLHSTVVVAFDKRAKNRKESGSDLCIQQLLWRLTSARKARGVPPENPTSGGRATPTPYCLIQGLLHY